MTNQLTTPNGKYWIGNNINADDFVLIRTKTYGYLNGDVTFVVEKSTLNKIPNCKNWSIEDKASAFLAVYQEGKDSQYVLTDVVTDSSEVKQYVRGYNHSIYKINPKKSNDYSQEASDFYGFAISSTDDSYYAKGGTLKNNTMGKSMYADGGQPRSLKGKNFSDKIENNQTFKRLINETYSRQSIEHKYPQEFIKAIALTDKPIVKSNGSLYVKGYTYAGTLSHFEFMDLPSFRDALELVDRPTPQNFKFEDGGSIGVGGTMDTSMADAPMIGGTMSSSMFDKGGMVKVISSIQLDDGLEELAIISKHLRSRGIRNTIDGQGQLLVHRDDVDIVKSELNRKFRYAQGGRFTRNPFRLYETNSKRKKMATDDIKKGIKHGSITTESLYDNHILNEYRDMGATDSDSREAIYLAIVGITSLGNGGQADGGTKQYGWTNNGKTYYTEEEINEMYPPSKYHYETVRTESWRPKKLVITSKNGEQVSFSQNMTGLFQKI